MHHFRAFPDLRVNARSQTSDSALWPSFTDIMTVILMVFMLTMIVVIVKNAHLVDRMRLSQIRLEESEDRLRIQVDQLALLRSRSIDLEDDLRAKKMEIILLTDELANLDEIVAAKLVFIDELTDQNRALLENLRVVQLSVVDKEAEIAGFQARIDEISVDSERAQEELNRQLALLLSQLQDKEAALIMRTSEKTDLELTLARQRQDFSSLEDKYLKLVHPARSSLGKLVATVRYARVEGRPVITFRDIDGSDGVQLTKTQLHARLTALKEQHGEKLYVKIVIPDNSGLSYNEAWDFTKEILSSYDYYYVDGW